MDVGERGEGQPSGDRCIVWHPHGVSPDGELLGALSRRGMQVSLCDNACEAFAHLCVLGSRHRAIEGASPPATVLLLSDPERLQSAAEVVTLTERYAPRAVCWVFDTRDSQRLRAVVQDDLARWSSSTKSAPATAPAVGLSRQTTVRALSGPGRTRASESPGAALAAAIAGPRLRLAGEGPLPPSSEDSADLPRLGGDRGGGSEKSVAEAADASPSPLLSDQELSMLLAKDPLPGQD